MIFTEKEAQTKWCPFARAFTYGDSDSEDSTRVVTVNRDRGGGPDSWCHCMASQCMAWRWGNTDKGYCGLVTGPEYSK